MRFKVAYAVLGVVLYVSAFAGGAALVPAPAPVKVERAKVANGVSYAVAAENFRGPAAGTPSIPGLERYSCASFVQDPSPTTPTLGKWVAILCREA